ncbi:MAG: hypothetical protein ABJA98_08895 [Acidobacteriota bacterium]
MLRKDHYLDLAGGKFNLTTSADLGRLFEAVERSPLKDSLVVHFHGGLVSRAQGEKAAEGLMPYYESGAAYPVFFLWRSDLQSTFAQNLNQIAREPVFKRLVKRLIQLALGKLVPYLGGRAGGVLELPDENEMPDDLEGLAAYAAAREPAPSSVQGMTLTNQQFDQAQTELESDEVIQIESRAITEYASPLPPDTARARSARGAAVTPRPTLMSTSVVNELVSERGGSGERLGILTFATLAIKGVLILKRVIDRFGAARDHALYPTVVEETLRELYVDSLGALSWALMKRDTEEAFGDDPLLHGGTAFVNRLAAWWKPGRRVCLVGHSTGAIYIGHFLEHADAALPSEARFDVAFLAPACSFEFMAGKLPVFRRRVSRFRMFALKEELERGYWEIPLLYPASLLYMVSGMFEEPTVDMPIVGMQRYYSAAAPYAMPEITAVADYVRENSVWSLAEGAPGLCSSAAKHGAFDEDVPTLESLREFLRGGR